MQFSYCSDCSAPAWYHAGTWLDEVLARALPTRFLRRVPPQVDQVLLQGLERLLRALGLARYEKNFDLGAVPSRSRYFAEAARKHGVEVEALKGPSGYTGHFRMRRPQGRWVRFEGLPLPEAAARHRNAVVDDKAETKRALRDGFFPHAEGRAFAAWQGSKAVQYGESLGFPLAVKPRGGSVARHVTVPVRDVEELRAAVSHALRYSPSFLVERFVPGHVHRATVLGYDQVYCVRQLPAHVVGDGAQTVAKLVAAKNAARAEPTGAYPLYHPIRLDASTEVFLAEQGHQLHKVPAPGETVLLSQDPFLRNGGDLEDVTDRVHPENALLFRELARHFEVPLVGIDFVAHDIGASWKEGGCAVLELNSLPSIELHHEPTYGEPRDVAGDLLRLVLARQ